MKKNIDIFYVVLIISIIIELGCFYFNFVSGPIHIITSVEIIFLIIPTIFLIFKVLRKYKPINNLYNSISKNRNLIITIFIIVFIIVFIILCAFSSDVFEKQAFKNKALKYFSDKYYVDQKDIKIIENALFPKKHICIDGCNDKKYLLVTYNNKKFEIYYNEDDNIFTDDYQYDEIYKDLTNYLKNKFNYISKIKIDFLDEFILDSQEKYKNNIEEYFGVRNNNNTCIKIWIKAKDENEAKELFQKNHADLINELNYFKINYDIIIAANNLEADKNDYFYYYHMKNEHISLVDNIDNHRFGCNKDQLLNGNCPEQLL